jgi:hypothetical protein
VYDTILFAKRQYFKLWLFAQNFKAGRILAGYFYRFAAAQKF